VDSAKGAEGPYSPDGREDALLLDFGGTLDADGIHWSPRLHAAYAAAGGSLPPDAFHAVFLEAQRVMASEPDVRALGFRDTTRRLTLRILSRLPEAGSLDAHAMEHRFHADARAVVTRNRPVLERLARTHRIGAVSNFTGNLEPCMEELGIRQYFDAVVDSGCFGVSKPDARIFEEALRRLDAPASSTWMVGDNPGADILPALNLGMNACWVAPPERPFPGARAPTARIARFPEIERVLEGASTD
jgi:HAD superfamily hydrolase (TIGR01509 family)